MDELLDIIERMVEELTERGDYHLGKDYLEEAVIAYENWQKSDVHGHGKDNSSEVNMPESPGRSCDSQTQSGSINGVRRKPPKGGSLSRPRMRHRATWRV